MDLAVLGLTHEQLTFAFWLAIAAFAIYLTFKRLQKIGAPDDRQSYYVADLPEDPLRNPDEPVSIAWFKRGEEAEMWAANLRAEGIDASVCNTALRGHEGLRGYASPQVQVRWVDALRAAEILREASAKEHLDGEQDVPGTPPGDD